MRRFEYAFECAVGVCVALSLIVLGGFLAMGAIEGAQENLRYLLLFFPAGVFGFLGISILGDVLDS